jgi:hypothetical protein
LYGPALAAIILNPEVKGMLGYTVSEVARRVGSRPRDISDLFYRRDLPDDSCPIVGGRRLIPPEFVPVIVAALRERGCLPPPRDGG